MLQPLIDKFLPFAQKRLGFSKPPRLFVRSDNKNAKNPLGKTAFYNAEDHSITLYVINRHPKDVLRSLSHELVHHTQNCRGELGDISTSPGYAQSDDHMREMEREAYEVGNMCFRDWEDGIKNTIYYEHLQKGEFKMSIKDWKNEELRTILSEAWGFKFNTLQEFEEFGGTGELQAEGEEELEEFNLGKQASRTRKGRRMPEPEPEDKDDTDADVTKEGEKPDFLDGDKDGDKNESIKRLQEAIAKMLRKHIKG